MVMKLDSFALSPKCVRIFFVSFIETSIHVFFRIQYQHGYIDPGFNYYEAIITPLSDLNLYISLPFFRHEESKVRKAYFRMAQKYHPDKNPEGRPMFEKANKAYEFLCSRDTMKDGPDPNNIVLILRSQSILFTRYQHGMRYVGWSRLF